MHFAFDPYSAFKAVFNNFNLTKLIFEMLNKNYNYILLYWKTSLV